MKHYSCSGFNPKMLHMRKRQLEIHSFTAGSMISMHISATKGWPSSVKFSDLTLAADQTAICLLHLIVLVLVVADKLI